MAWGRTDSARSMRDRAESVLPFNWRNAPSGAGLACGARSIGRRVDRIIRRPEIVDTNARRGDVGVGIFFPGIIEHAARNHEPCLRRRNVGRAGPLVVVPCFLAELEVDYVLLGEYFVEKRLPRDTFGGQPVVRALLVELGKRGSLVSGAVRSFSPYEGVLVICNERLLEIRRIPRSAQPIDRPCRGVAEILRITRIVSRLEERVEKDATTEISTAACRAVKLVVEVCLGRQVAMRERAKIVPGVARDALLRFVERGLVRRLATNLGGVHEEARLERVRHRRPLRGVAAVDQISCAWTDVGRARCCEICYSGGKQ